MPAARARGRRGGRDGALRSERGHEVAVEAFLDGRIPSPAIAEVIERDPRREPAVKAGYFEDLFAVDGEARERARS